MKFISQIIIIAIISLFSQTAISQVYKYKATSFSIMERDQKGNWGDWSEFDVSTSIITIDGKKDRVVVASQEIQLYKIMNYGDKVSSKTEDVIALNCIDNDGGDVTILVVTKKNQQERMQFYINYKDIKIVYNVYKI